MFIHAGSITRPLSRSGLLLLVALVLAASAVFTGANPAQATGNNGTIKVHALGSEPGSESNEPQVCAFNLEFFGFDEGTDGYVMFDVQGGDGPTGVAAGPFAVGPANADGYFESEYFNVEGGPVITNGHYKVTMYGKFNGEPNYEDIKAKSKVFKVDCLPTEEPPPVTPPVTPPVEPPVGTPPVETTPVPPTTTPTTPTTPVVIKKGTGTVVATCVTPTMGEGYAWGRTSAKNTANVSVKAKQGKKVLKKRTVKPGTFFKFPLKNLKVGTPVRLYVAGKLVDRDQVERQPGCEDPTLPHVGLRKKNMEEARPAT